MSLFVNAFASISLVLSDETIWSLHQSIIYCVLTVYVIFIMPGPCVRTCRHVTVEYHNNCIGEYVIVYLLIRYVYELHMKHVCVCFDCSCAILAICDHPLW